MRHVYLFDLDGTLCDIEHRLHFIRAPELVGSIGQDEAFKPDWDAFFDACGMDSPIEHMVGLARLLKHDSIYISGRSDRVQSKTTAWLQLYGLIPCQGLYMRKHGDHRPDHVVKLELLGKIKDDGFTPIMAFDDRQQVVDMWRTNGVPCAQVAEGNY
jgi:phosphoglycolate phosphatase-like HAD superfamily hydrolase